MNGKFWSGKRVLVTGHNGFKGCWITKYLDMAGGIVCGISLPAEKESVFSEIEFSNRFINYEGDITDYCFIKKVFDDFKPEIVIHLAAQAIVKNAMENPQNTFNTNVMGIVNVMECVRNTSTVKTVLAVTSDKVYENKEQNKYFDESDRIFGYEPYSASKACQEIAVAAYRETYLKDRKIGVATARAANTFGGGDNHFDRLLPYLIRCAYKGEDMILRNPDAIRPWQYILDLVRGYLLLAQRLYEDYRKYSSGYNFGPDKDELYTVGEIAKLIGKVSDTAEKTTFKEANVLMINAEKSLRELDWKPIYTVPEGIETTCEMYNSYFHGISYNVLIENEIMAYEKNLEVRND
ncbi:CDP-glucose 4,6-dehydratase [Clostridium butyricum]|uniref:CDP-glucose 4,6-dehydratase n=1 Tax=Clostridium butyricum TaxID=1492 RepID=UPI0021031F7A|nr:CDP-glucose 4,6-dehydratase [Clostridium butyricum]MCQ2018560.1 CDP-glucose 4,6-dehydratase [Clostridium butyricum]UTY52207.1 CDP-glucose 4,6-dehydratase [Clostridium butyricum]